MADAQYSSGTGKSEDISTLFQRLTAPINPQDFGLREFNIGDEHSSLRVYRDIPPGTYYFSATAGAGTHNRLIPSATVELAAVISRALGDDDMRSLIEAASAKALSEKRNFSLPILDVVAQNVIAVMHGIPVTTPFSVLAVYLSQSGYNYNGAGIPPTKLPWRAGFTDVLQHASYFTQMHPNITSGGFAGSLSRKALLLEQRLSGSAHESEYAQAVNLQEPHFQEPLSGGVGWYVPFQKPANQE
ncbi:hypothetical protein HYU15_03155 [Candidatus Woesearchaeota archaeon]|nr:hypothetical protein [Candidatus Woesearchaeota archaeon]